MLKTARARLIFMLKNTINTNSPARESLSAIIANSENDLSSRPLIRASSILEIGPAALIHEARRARKLFGGGMRQAGIIAAGAIHAIEHHRDRLAEDHVHARMLGDACQGCPTLSIRGGRIDTNIVICEIDPDWGTASDLVSMLEQQGIRCFAISAQAVRFVTHLDVGREQIERACQVIQELAGRPLAQSR